MTWIDTAILAAYFVLMIGAGLNFSRRSATGVRSYFLGDNESKWWMLACSGASTHYSIGGTVWMISMLMVLGNKSWWIALIWWMPNAVVLMSYMGIWIRRTGVVTSAELNRIRFGTDAGAYAARCGFAVMVLFFSIASLAMSYLIVHKFAQVFGYNGHWAAMLVIGATGLYVLVGGFRGVIFTDFLQTLLLFGVSFLIGYLCFTQYSANQLHTSLAHGEVTTSYWKSLSFDPRPNLGVFADSDYSSWRDFAGAALAFSLVGLIGCAGGAGGRYGEQRFLAARTARQAGWMAALWQVLGLPRWVVVGGLAYLGFTYFNAQTVAGADPDAVMPLFLKSELLIPGIKGLVVTGLVAAYMSTFSSEVNASASILVRDLYEPIFGREKDTEEGGHMLPSYLATAALVLLSIWLGYMFVSNSSLNAIWSWMLGGLLTCYVVPLALRWYWGRMNGWGFAAGSVIGLIPALTMLSKQFIAKDAWLQSVPDSYFTYSILLLSLLTCIIVSLLTKPVESEHIDKFYRLVRPFGWWKSVSRRALSSDLPANAPLSVKMIPINLALGLVASYTLYMSPVYFLGAWYVEAGLCMALFGACCIVMYFTWYRALPTD